MAMWENLSAAIHTQVENKQNINKALGFTVVVIDIKRKNRLLKVCYVPTTSATFLAFFLFFLAAAI
jgi:hypothetical protein